MVLFALALQTVRGVVVGDAEIGVAGARTTTVSETVVNGNVTQRTTTDTVVVAESAAAHEEAIEVERRRHSTTPAVPWWGILLIIVGALGFCFGIWWIIDAEDSCLKTYRMPPHNSGQYRRYTIVAETGGRNSKILAVPMNRNQSNDRESSTEESETDMEAAHHNE